MRLPTRLLLASLLAAGLPLAAPAGEQADTVKKQKEAAEKNLQAAELKAAHVETDDLLVFATIPEAKAKPLAAAMQKAFDVAAKTVKADDKLFPGKLTAYVFADPRQYKGFVLQALKRPAGKGETYALELRADPPFLLVGTDPGVRPTDAQWAENAAGLVASAVLAKHAGSTAAIPEPVLLGFGKAASLRADGNANRLAAHRNRVRAAYNRTRGQAFKLDWVTGGQVTPDTDAVATSLAEYLAFGPGAEKFPAVLTGLKPSDENPMPTLQSALTAADWKPEAFEPAWQKWVVTGR